jgi:two-component system C4-dicarboxylate transport sensor histidine kinase DctB
VLSARAVAGLLITLLAVGAGVVLRRRQQAMARAIAEEQARAELERRIDDRTQELRAANGRLSREIDERRRAEASREVLREELVQANKLATLGQIAAGVAHEINQPVAAIRTHADTATAYLDRDDPEAARRSLGRVAELTGRIGVITDELRAFSRKSTQGVSAVSPAAAIDGALLLIGGRLREGGVELVRGGEADVRVQAEPIRLEQVVVNLVQNAFEAMTDAGTPSPTLTIDVARKGRRVEIVIGDNGPGVDPAVASALFTPFVTTKPAGLGLGLVICRDIVAGFGGELSLRPSPAGAQFVIALRPAA